MKPSNPLFSRWIKIAFGLSFLALLAGGGWTYHIQQETMRQKVEENLTAIARLKVDQITAWRNNQMDHAGLIAKNYFLIRNVEKYLTEPKEETLQEIRIILDQVKHEHDYHDIILVGPEGRIILTLNGFSAAGYVEELKAWSASAHDRKPVFVKLHTDAAETMPHISVIAPLFSGSEQGRRPLGAVILITDASRFLFPLIQSSTTAETLLVRRDGDHVLFLNELRHQPDTALKLRIPLSRTDTPAVMAVLGRKGFVQGKDYRRVEVAAVIMPVPGTSAFMIAKIDANEAFADLNLHSAMILVFILTLMALMGGIGLVVLQRDKKARFRALYLAESTMRAVMERHSIILKSITDAVIATDVRGIVEMFNPAAEALTGWTDVEARGKPVQEVFHVVDEETLEKVEDPVAKVLRANTTVRLVNHALLIARDGTRLSIADSGSPIRDNNDEITGVVLVFKDQSKERQIQRLTQARLHLIEYAAVHTLDELLTRTLDEITALVDSPIGFFHFVESDQQTLSLQQWSTRTLKEFCRAEGNGLHYSIEQAGVWTDCVKEKKPVIHNDYEALQHKKGLPEGHAEVIRELVIPVLREHKIVAILGVGNKPVDYTEKDVEVVSFLADVSWEIIKRKRVEKRLQYLSAIVEQSTEGMSTVDLDGTFTYMNNACCTMHGYTNPEELIGKNLSVCHTQEQMENDVHPFYEKVLEFGTWKGEVGHVTKEGKPFPTLMVQTVLKNDHGKPFAVASITKDIKELKNLEAQFRQAQKMESVGRLAGGVAHDYNNMLSVILGYTDLALDATGPDSPLRADLNEIRNAATRSAAITRQLLTFARKQTVAPKKLDLNETVEGMLKMLRRLIGEDIDLAWLPGVQLRPVNMDPTQMDQILANLCVNARDAISGVGKVTIETGMKTFDKAYCDDHSGFVPGEFVRMEVSDDGCGMDKENIGKIFEPFFTTKETGKGTGLGLATVYGIVKQNNGFVNVYSEPGQGTTFKIYLPSCAAKTEAIREKKEVEVQPGGGETVLLVEDEPMIMEMGKRMLEAFDYQVLTAGTPSEAERLVGEHADDIALLITDVVMPEMNGRDLADLLLASSPDIKVLFMSGYTANVIAHRGILDDEVNFIQKPFSKKDLAAKVREVLDRK